MWVDATTLGDPRALCARFAVRNMEVGPVCVYTDLCWIRRDLQACGSDTCAQFGLEGLSALGIGIS